MRYIIFIKKNFLKIIKVQLTDRQQDLVNRLQKITQNFTDRQKQDCRINLVLRRNRGLIERSCTQEYYSLFSQLGPIYYGR